MILLHGFPETSFAWRFQIPVLAQHYRVIAPDLRGYGETDKPATGYDKRTMARDIRELMRALDLPKIALVGHDRGARVATRFAKDYPDLLDRLVVIDNVPTRVVARDHQCRHRQGLLVLPIPPGARPARSADRRTRAHLAEALLLRLDLRPVDDLR